MSDAKNTNFCLPYGLKTFDDLLTLRQMLRLLTFAATVRQALEQMPGSGGGQEKRQGTAAVQKLSPGSSGPGGAERLGVRQTSGALAGDDKQRQKAVGSYLAVLVNRQAD